MVGIISKDIHKLLPDESHSFLDGYVLESVGIKLTWATYLKLSELSLYPYKDIEIYIKKEKMKKNKAFFIIAKTRFFFSY